MLRTRALFSCSRVVFALCIATVVAACPSNEGPEPPPPPPPVPSVCLAEGGPVDVLFVIDSSSSVDDDTGRRLVLSLNAFLAPLLTSGLDYHVGVVTSDPTEGGVLRAYDGPPVDGCASCRFITSAVACDDVAADITGLDSAEREALLADRCPAWLVLADLLDAGTLGSSFEASFDMAAAALGDDAPPQNEGFRRAGAPLHVVFISDENEGAKSDGLAVRYYERLFEGLAGVGNDALVTTSSIVGIASDVDSATIAELCPILSTRFDDDVTNDDPRALALLEAIHSPEAGCSGPGGDPLLAFAESGGRYIELGCRTGGAFASLCDDDLGPAMSEIAAVVLARCAEGACIEDADCDETALCDGDGDGNDDGVGPAVCVDGVACLRDAHCAFGSICDGGACLEGCRDIGDCPFGMKCDAGVCAFSCDFTGECNAGELCINGECAPDPRGVCQPCSASCERPSQCITDATTGFSFCASDCYAGQECPSGFNCSDVRIAPPAAPFCNFPETCEEGLCSRNTSTACAVDEDCPEGGRGGDCHLQNGGRFGACALDPSTPCASSSDCALEGDECRLIECRGALGDTFGHCSCVRDDDCPNDVCLGADVSDPANPVAGRCELSGRECFETFECDILACVEGACFFGAVCTPSGDRSCDDIL